MVEKVPSLKGGGAFWFSDLTTPDSLYLLPVLTSLTFLITVEVRRSFTVFCDRNSQQKFEKLMFRDYIILILHLFICQFPKLVAVSLYNWIFLII